MTTSPKSELESARESLRARISTAFLGSAGVAYWDIPDDGWVWFLNDPSTRSRVRRLNTEEEIRSEMEMWCPLMMAGDCDSCRHADEFIALYRQNWGIVVATTEPPVSFENPVEIPKHRHPKISEKILLVSGRGVFFVENEEFAVYTQSTIDIPAGVWHGGTMHHPARWIAAFRTVSGERSYGGDPDAEPTNP